MEQSVQRTGVRLLRTPKRTVHRQSSGLPRRYMFRFDRSVRSSSDRRTKSFGSDPVHVPSISGM